MTASSSISLTLTDPAQLLDLRDFLARAEALGIPDGAHIVISHTPRERGAGNDYTLRVTAQNALRRNL